MSGRSNLHYPIDLILLHPPKAVLEFGQKKGETWNKFIRLLSGYSETIPFARYSDHTVSRRTVNFCVEQALRETGKL